MSDDIIYQISLVVPIPIGNVKLNSRRPPEMLFSRRGFDAIVQFMHAMLWLLAVK